MNIPTVDSLPVLDQTEFPAFPEVPTGSTLLSISTALQSAEKEFAADSIVNACLLTGKWQPVHAEQLFKQMRAHPLIAPFFFENVVSGLWNLFGEGFITVVNFQGANHFVPTPQLANVMLPNPGNLRIAENRLY